MKRFTVICIVIILSGMGVTDFTWFVSYKLNKIAASLYMYSPSKRHQLPRMKSGMKKPEKVSMVVTITHGVPDYGFWWICFNHKNMHHMSTSLH